MPRIYHSTFNTPLSPDVFNPLLHLLPDKMREKVMRYRRWEDRHAALLGKHLLIKAMKDRGLTADLNEMSYTSAGRPYLAALPDFNISHSGNMVVCVISEQGKIGIDLEEIRSADHTAFRACFSQQEWYMLMQPAAPPSLFYQYWTIKEAILKADGRGISDNLAILNTAGVSAIALDHQLWHVMKVEAFSGYACHIATTTPKDAYTLEEVSF